MLERGIRIGCKVRQGIHRDMRVVEEKLDGKFRGEILLDVSSLHVERGKIDDIVPTVKEEADGASFFRCSICWICLGIMVDLEFNHGRFSFSSVIYIFIVDSDEGIPSLFHLDAVIGFIERIDPGFPLIHRGK